MMPALVMFLSDSSATSSRLLSSQGPVMTHVIVRTSPHVEIKMVSGK